MTVIAVLKYLEHNYPACYHEAVQNTSAPDINISTLATLWASIEDSSYKSMYFIAASLVIFSPSTLNAGNIARVGLLKEMADVMRISKPGVSKRIPSVRQYYRSVGWFKDNVNSLIEGINDIRSTNQ